MADTKEVDPDVAALWERLDAITVRISSNRGELSGLYEERNQLFDLLVAAGEKQAVIARRAGMTRMGVNFAIRKMGRDDGE